MGSSHPSTYTPKIARRRTSARRTLALAGAVVIVFAFGFGLYANSGANPKPSNCANLDSYQTQIRQQLYTSFPTINQSAAVRSFMCDEPSMNFGEMTSPQTEKFLGGNGFVELHSLTAAQVANSSIDVSKNLHPGIFFFVAIAHIHNATATVVSTCTSTLPDPNLIDAANCLGIRL
ncbi:MAG: hypothetical protein KGI38_11420 [Thaumarchaeota archaeon]|nr:hypothetical protein [Nitrososphaerota archaeon]